TMPRVSEAQQQAGPVEVWAARAWNVFNEGRPFSIVYPLMVLLAAAPLGLAPEGSLVLALLGAGASALALSRFSFALRGRALLWLAALAALPLLEPWRAPGLLAGALAGYVLFTVVVWGSIYYHLRTGAPWTNGLRFWRLVLTNSDPTSGNALEQLPKLLIALGAATRLAEEPGAGSLVRVAAAVAVAAALGALAARTFAARLPRYPERAPGELPDEGIAERVYVIVVDGCNRGRLWQAHAPVMDRLAREGTEYLAVEPAYPARTVVCFSSMLTGATPAEHGMRSNFAPRLGVQRESIFDVLERHGRSGQLVGIAHLLDPFGEDVVRSVTSVQPTSQIDASLVAEGRRVVEDEDPDLLVLQLLAADQLGHVRGVRSPEYLNQLAETDRHVGGFLRVLEDSGRLDRATVILMADHGQGRGIGGHGHLDWGERPVPFVVWGEGALPGTVSSEPRSVLELAPTIARLLGVPQPDAARGRPLVPAEDPQVGPPRRAAALDRCLAIVVARDEEPAIGRVLAGLPGSACEMPVDVLLVDDGSRDATASIGREHGARVHSVEHSRGLGAALRTGLEIARDEGYAAAVYIDGDGEYDPADLERVLEPVVRGRADYVLGSRFLGRREGMSWHRTLANRSTSALLGFLLGTVTSDAQTGYRAFSARALAAARIRHDYNYAQVLTLSLWGAGIDALEVPISYRRRANGRSFVRYPEYLARVGPAVWREWRAARASRRASSSTATPTAPASQNGQPPPGSNRGSRSVSGPNGASGRSPRNDPSPQRTSA
ncbi:MAG TPA: alkaline phosphatase family protein, partial [Thermoleophilaceae bacterium]|nr:alkaline phosphatase family protein [Thermoleophilaceae bacterium]